MCESVYGRRVVALVKGCVRGRITKCIKHTKADSSFLLISENREFNILWVTQRVTCSFMTSKELVSSPVFNSGSS